MRLGLCPPYIDLIDAKLIVAEAIYENLLAPMKYSTDPNTVCVLLAIFDKYLFTK